LKKASQKVLDYRIRLAKRHPNSCLSPEEIIAKALERRVYVAWSGGRCSTMVVHLAIQQDPDIPIVFTNTGVEYPETVKFVRNLAKEWSLNFTELKPDFVFWDIVKEYGFPQLRGSTKKKGVPRRPKCCELLKEKPPLDFMEKHGLEGVITGIRVEESRPRALAIYKKGPYYYAKRDRMWKFHPIALISLEELMDYHRAYNIPMNPLYKKGLPRIGCMPCTGFIGWREQLKATNPKLFMWLNREYQKWKGTPTLWEYQDIYDICDESLN